MGGTLLARSKFRGLCLDWLSEGRLFHTPLSTAEKQDRASEEACRRLQFGLQAARQCPGHRGSDRLLLHRTVPFGDRPEPKFCSARLVL